MGKQMSKDARIFHVYEFRKELPSSVEWSIAAWYLDDFLAKSCTRYTWGGAHAELQNTYLKRAKYQVCSKTIQTQTGKMEFSNTLWNNEW